MNIVAAIRLLRSIELPPTDYAVFGSGPLLVRGIITDAADVDVISRGAAWTQAQDTGAVTYLEEHNVTVCSFFGGLVTVGTSWAYGQVDIVELIDTAEMIDGLPFVRLEHVIAYKRIASRPKDLAHLQLTEEWLASREVDDH